VSERGRRLLFGVALLALAGGAGLLIALESGPEEESSFRREVERTSSAPGERPPEADKALAAISEHAGEHEETRDAHRVRKIVGDPSEERDVRRQEMRTFAADRAAAEPVARRFFAAFARYELGRVSRRVERGLRASTTSAFARELLRAPPRVPQGAPSLARLGGLDFVAGESRGRRLVALEFVGSVARGRERTPLALALRRTGGGWRVDALGR